MLKQVRRPRIYINTGFCIWITAALFLVPLRWILAWFAAAALHELGHIAALAIFDVNIGSIEIFGAGCKIQTSQMKSSTEMICASSGPLVGGFLLFFSKIFPRIALCAFIQTVYNILPVYPLDGGRIIRAVVKLARQKNTLQTEQAGSTIGKIK